MLRMTTAYYQQGDRQINKPFQWGQVFVLG